MNAVRIVIILSILLALPLVGCKKKPEVPPPSLPRVERPTLTLNFKPGEQLKIRIPRQAMVERGGIPGVFVLSTTGEARFRMVRAGKTSDTRVEILSGLTGNETLVLGDLAAVHDGNPITAVTR